MASQIRIPLQKHHSSCTCSNYITLMQCRIMETVAFQNQYKKTQFFLSKFQ